jgi:hypothetical protein
MGATFFRLFVAFDLELNENLVNPVRWFSNLKLLDLQVEIDKRRERLHAILPGND